MKKNKQENHSLPFFGVPKLYPYVRKYKPHLVFMVTLGLFVTAIEVAMPLFQRYALNHYVAERTLDTIWTFIALYVTAIVLRSGMDFLTTYRASCVEVWIDRDLRNRAFEHLQTLSFSYFNQNSVGYIHARVMSDTERIASTLAWDMMEGVWHISYLVCVVVMMLSLHWKLALCVLLVVPAVVLASVYFQKKLVVLHRQVRE